MIDIFRNKMYTLVNMSVLNSIKLNMYDVAVSLWIYVWRNKTIPFQYLNIFK